MATNTNNGGRGRYQNHQLPSSLLDGISPCPYFYTPDWGLRDNHDANSVPLPLVFAVFLGVILLLRFFCTRGVRTETAEQDAGGAAVEMAPPLASTYRNAEGLEEDSCGACLADLADGEAVVVLPVCMHYFHVACIGEWLHGHDTCLLCRARLATPGGAT